MEIFNWRYKTYLPIVKPASYALSPNSKYPNRNPQLPVKPPHLNNGNNSFNQPTGGNANRQSQTAFGQNDLCELVVKIEDIKCRLSDIDMLPLSQIIYLLKEMMIGYDTLVDIFGMFGPTEQMVAVSNNSQWKVWINEDFFKNTKASFNPAAGER